MNRICGNIYFSRSFQKTYFWGFLLLGRFQESSSTAALQSRNPRFHTQNLDFGYFILLFLLLLIIKNYLWGVVFKTEYLTMPIFSKLFKQDVFGVPNLKKVPAKFLGNRQKNRKTRKYPKSWFLVWNLGISRLESSGWGTFLEPSEQ